MLTYFSLIQKNLKNIKSTSIMNRLSFPQFGGLAFMIIPNPNKDLLMQANTMFLPLFLFSNILLIMYKKILSK